MRFINGTISVRGAHDIVFWYTDHSFDPHVWRQQFDAAGGNKAALRRIPNYSPTTVRIGLDGSTLPERTSFFGSDFHDVGDDAIFVTGQIGGTVTGVRIWDVDEAGVDPGFGGNNPRGDLIHNDSIQTSGGLQHFAVTDSFLGQNLQWGAQAGSNHDTEFARLWIAGSAGFGMILDTENGHTNTGSMKTIRAWGNGTHTEPYDPAFDRFRLDILDGQRRVARHLRRAGACRGARNRRQRPSSAQRRADERRPDAGHQRGARSSRQPGPGLARATSLRFVAQLLLLRSSRFRSAVTEYGPASAVRSRDRDPSVQSSSAFVRGLPCP